MPTATQTAIIPTSVRRAEHWYLASGIQEAAGGVARYYRADLGRNNRISTEITGYAVSALCQMYRWTANPAAPDAACRAADFLIQQAWDPASAVFPYEWPPTASPEQNRAFFFDCGIIVRGLLTVHRFTKRESYREVAVACGRGMSRAFEQNGELVPILQLPSLQALPRGNSWSNNPGCYQLKSALAWRELFDVTGAPEFEQLWETALARALAGNAGFLPGTSEPLRVMDRLHAYGYFLEALLPVSGRPACREALQQGIARAATCLRELAPDFARSDVYAQILRVRVLADQCGAAPLDFAQAREEAEAIPAFQYESTDRRLDGGFSFGKRNGELMPFANPVSTAFCAQALHMWDEHRRGVSTTTWKDLI